LAVKVSYKASVERDLGRIDRKTAIRLMETLEKQLGNNPDAGKPLSGEFKGLFRLRSGDYRVIYSRVPGAVLVLRIAHRKDVYR